MKKIFISSIVLFLCIGLLACSRSERNNSYESDYDLGYLAGYEEGLLDGVSEAREDLAREAWDKYWAMEGQTAKERGLHPEDAIIVLNDYLDGKSVSKDELRTAIKSITYFYYNAWDVIGEIEYMNVYFD